MTDETINNLMIGGIGTLFGSVIGILASILTDWLKDRIISPKSRAAITGAKQGQGTNSGKTWKVAIAVKNEGKGVDCLNSAYLVLDDGTSSNDYAKNFEYGRFAFKDPVFINPKTIETTTLEFERFWDNVPKELRLQFQSGSISIPIAGDKLNSALFDGRDIMKAILIHSSKDPPQPKWCSP